MIDLYAIIKERVPERDDQNYDYLYSIFELKRKADGELRWVEHPGTRASIRFTTLEAAQEKYPHAIYIGESEYWLNSYPFKEEHLSETN